jgi:hypothetical protein
MFGRFQWRPPDKIESRGCANEGGYEAAAGQHGAGVG